MLISTTTLLTELDRLPHAGRMRALAGWSSALAATGELPQVVAQLRQRGPYERRLALLLATIAGDSDGVRAALADPDLGLRVVAMTTCLRSGWLDTAALLAEFRELPAAGRRALCRWLRSGRGGRRSGWADALVDLARVQFGDREAARLLPACGAATVARLLPALEHAIGCWRVLGRRHPEVMIDYAARVLPELPAPAQAEWWRQHGSGVLAAGDPVPGAVLDLLERFAPQTWLPGSPVEYGVLAAHDPGRTLDLVTAPARASALRHWQLSPALCRRFARLAVERLVVLGTRLRPAKHHFTRLLRAMPPAARGPLLDAVMTGAEAGATVYPLSLLDVLPRHWQQREARRILGLPQIRADERATLQFIAYLPWAEAEPVLSAATRRAEAIDRASAYRLLVAAARRSRDPAALAAALEHLRRLRNEQDPVRSVALGALPAAAAWLRPGSAEVLAQLVTDAAEARDASAATLSAVRDLAMAVLRHHHSELELVRWVTATLDRLFARAIQPLGRLDTVLRHGQERALFAALQPWVEAGMARGRFEPLFTVSHALGRRGWQLPELQELLRQAVTGGPVASVLRRAVSLWLEPPRSRAERVAEVLRADPSTVTLPVVWRTLCARRTDLLDGVLAEPGPAGGLLNTGVRWVPGHATHLHRWVPRQWQAYAALQEQVAADSGRTYAARAAAIWAAAKVPDHGWRLVRRFLDSSDVNLAEAALGALPWTDRPAAALPELLARAAGDRARVAAYAAGRAARFVSPAALAEMLGAVAAGGAKVTARKEAVRLLGRLGGSDAAAGLVAVWQQAGQHRDVRAAVAAAAARRLELPAGWQILQQAVAGEREEALAVVAVRPAEVPRPARPRFATLVTAAAASTDGTVARTAWQQLPWWGQWAPDLAGLAATAASQLEHDLVWSAASMAIAQLYDHHPADRPALLRSVLAELIRLDAADTDPGRPGRDRPARRRIKDLTEQVAGVLEQAGRELGRGPALDAARYLARQPGYLPIAARLLMHLVPLEPPHAAERLVPDLAEVAQLVIERPVLAGSLAQVLTQRLWRRRGTGQETELLAAAEAMAIGGDLPGGMFAVTLVEAVGREGGWPADTQALLQRLRHHPAPDARSAATDLVMTAS